MEFSEALKKAESWLDEIDGVQGVAEGMAEGEKCITVFVAGPDAAKKIPGSVGQYRILVEDSGHFHAQL